MKDVVGDVKSGDTLAHIAQVTQKKENILERRKTLKNHLSVGTGNLILKTGSLIKCCALLFGGIKPKEY